MTVFLTAFEWCKSHWKLLGAALAAFGAVYAESMRRGRAPAEKVEADASAVATSLSIKEIAVEQGAAAAHQKVAEQYKDTLANLSAEQQAHAATLLADPVALAKFLVDNNEVAP